MPVKFLLFTLPFIFSFGCSSNANALQSELESRTQYYFDHAGYGDFNVLSFEKSTNSQSYLISMEVSCSGKTESFEVTWSYNEETENWEPSGNVYLLSPCLDKGY